MKATTWSLALSLALAAVAMAADSPVAFNEIMYHPATNEPALEWVELHNQMSVDLDISRWSLDGGIHFEFGEGVIIPGGGYLVVASSPVTLMMATGLTNVLGPFTERLSNAGETLRLRNNNGRLMDEVTYGVEGDWPVTADGAGSSLARVRANVASRDAQNWSASAQVGGTPGAENFPLRAPIIVSNTVVAIDGDWKFNDTGTDLGTAWREVSYDDSAWATGAAVFFQEDGPLPAATNTPLAPGRVTYYFRTTFVFTGGVSGAQLQLHPLIDDGAVGYLNGIEVFRINMPGGAVNYSTLANGQVGDATFGATIVLFPEQLIAGTNVLAVEVHQAPTFTAYAQAVLDSSPVGYWRLGESNGVAIDSSPIAGTQNGTYAGFGATNLGQPGPRSTDFVNAQALAGFEADNLAPRFAGNNDGGNDVVTIPDAGVFNFTSTLQFTLEAWVNATTAQESGGAIFAKGTGGGGEQFAIDIVGGVFRFFCRNSAAAATVVSASVGPNGTWQHLVGVFEQSAGRMKIYVNGVEVGSGTPPASLLNTSHEVSIGARKNSGSINYDLNFDGRIDEVAIYDRALPVNEILAHFNAAFTNSVAAGPDTNDVVFALEVVSAETLPELENPRIVFNELASSTNADFWLEMINAGQGSVNLDGWIIARLGGATNREYVLPAQLLAPGQLLQVTKAEMGFGADSGDQLILYGPGRSNVFDAVVAKKEPRGRWPDGSGAWWFPQEATPGTSNIFVFRDELVINEIMYHARELLPEAATYSPTNLLISITNLWKYHAQGIDLGAAWRAPEYDDASWPASNSLFYAPTNPFVLPAPKKTFVPLTNAAGTRIITFYFRTQFTFTGDTSGLLLALRSVVDDGAVFYLNGVEAYRQGMPTTNISYATLAATNVALPGYSAPLMIAASNLVQGMNTLAVEVHQIIATSSDMYFGTELLMWRQLSPALPFRDSPESWVEIFNRSSNTVDLSGWRLDEGIDFRFPTNRMLAPGGYVVVAKDVAYVQSLYPSLDVLGPFTNKFSKRSDYFVLKDPNNNPADEVRYFDGGRWPEYADGGGASLELRDAHTDNAKPEAWAASDESAKASWQTLTWRGIAAPGQTGEPILWHELALCLLDGAGEVLLDDVSVIETPATTPKQLIDNGGFNAGAAHWRFLGTHRRSRVEPEPGNPGNPVLHLVASGAGEYQGNQIETTLSNNVAIVDGREYEISFRAKWLAGKRKLNARLYFNRLARTFDLAVPLRNGTPGAINSRVAPNIGPTFSALAHSPVVPSAGQPVEVSVTAEDPDGVGSVNLKYSIAGGAWQTAPMSSVFNDSTIQRFHAAIPGQPAATIVQFYVQATDSLGAVATFPARGTNSRALYVVQDNQAAASSLHNFRLVMTTADATYLHTGTNTLSNDLLGGTVIYDEREVFYDVGVRLKGSFVGRNVARVGFHVVFGPDQLFRGVHDVVSVDRSQHTLTGGIGEIVVKHIGNHAGGILQSYDDLARFIAPLPSYTVNAQLRLSAFDSDYLDAQFDDGSDGAMFEVEVLRWNNATVDGNPESPKQVGNESGGTGYANLAVQDYGNDKESYRWFLLSVNNRTTDDYTQGITHCKTFSLAAGTNFDAQAAQVLDVNEWLRTMAYQELVGTADAYFTGANIHNFRIYVRPEDQKVLYLPWDWDSAFLASSSASLLGSGNITKLLSNPNNLRAYYHQMFDIITTTFNTTYMSRWTTHYGALSGQNLSSILSYITARASFALGQLPTATAFAITSNSGNDFGTTNSTVTISGTAPISVSTIEINGVSYFINWTSTTVWTINVPLFAGTNLLVVQGVDNAGNRRTNFLDMITVTNTGPSALQPVIINEWMADNSGPGGFADALDGAFQDWFELFNPNTNTFNLSGYYLTDNLSQPAKWRVPTNTTIAARGFLLVWADNQTNQNGLSPSGDLHVGFQLNADGEAIGLFAPDGVTPQSTVVFDQQIQNVSRGLFPDGDTNSVYFMTNWTPRAPNTLDAPAAPSFVAATIFANTVSVSFSTMPSRTYRVEYKDDLAAPTWTQLGSNHVASGVHIIVADEIESGVSTQRFYRVLLLQ
jgi:hypothetical protein